jgi:hypothetical protein
VTLSDLAAIGSLASGAAVLVSLILLYFQLREMNAQSRLNIHHTRAMIQQTRNERIINNVLLNASHPAVNALQMRGDAGDPAMTPEEIIGYFNLCSAELIFAEDSFYQHRDGLIDDERNAGMVFWFRNVRAAKPGFRATWRIMRGTMGANFTRFADDVMAQMATAEATDDRATAALWHRLVAEEQATAAKGTPGSVAQ